MGGAGWDGGSHPPQTPATRGASPACRRSPRVWGRRRVSAGQEDGAALGGLQKPPSLCRVAAQGGGRREPQGPGGRWSRGSRRGRRGGSGVGAGGGGGGGGRGEGPCALAPLLPPTHSPHPLLMAPGAAASTSALPPRHRMAKRRWTAPRSIAARRSSRSWRTPPPTLLRRSEPRHTYATPPSSAPLIERGPERLVPLRTPHPCGRSPAIVGQQ